MSDPNRLDPELAAALAAAPGPAIDFAELSHADLPALRETLGDLAVRRAAAARAAAPRVAVEDGRTPDGLRLRIYRPADRPEPLPGLCWFHGGGMIVGTPEGDEAMMLRIAAEAGLAVVSVDYRLAPEHPHPAPVTDCHAGLLWTAEHGAALGIDTDRLAVGGSSAGGGLAAATALLVRDRGGPDLALQVLLYPMLDDRCASPSSLEFTDTPVWNLAASRFGWSALLGGSAGSGGVSRYAAPARAADLSGLPPTYLTVGEIEPFRDECLAFGHRLVQAGVPTEFHLYRGAFHRFDVLAPDAAVSRRAQAELVQVLSRALQAKEA
ncbi:alpha/beta hydrolase [Actinomadura decatromicini]|uniref:Alpha/beta hydrolase n=1 Tax=Actinomadura decatromicini TaxID=2604572 RepID=A0A5D3F8S3_9ACTN|nr:alpha/beta hydrolase [Actinomadura decatromicini]TYK44080.1 alpha/beta hydrolase [Actinomadura decatromicini]